MPACSYCPAPAVAHLEEEQLTLAPVCAACQAAENIDPVGEGTWLAEEAVRDIMRETGCTRIDAALYAMRGLKEWHRGVIPAASWPAVLDAAWQHLHLIVCDGGPKEVPLC